MILVVLLLAGIAVARIASTYGVFGPVVDEPTPLGRGIQWLTEERYSYVHHPPLAPVAFALGRYLDTALLQETGRGAEAERLETRARAIRAKPNAAVLIPR